MPLKVPSLKVHTVVSNENQRVYHKELMNADTTNYIWLRELVHTHHQIEVTRINRYMISIGSNELPNFLHMSS